MTSATRVKTPAVERLRQASEDIPGWCPEDQLLTLYLLAAQTQGLPGQIWEIGSWCGRSTVALALAAQDTDGATVQSIDLFPDRDDWYENPDDTFSFKVVAQGAEVRAHAIHKTWREPFERDILPVYERYGPRMIDTFLGFMARKGFGDLVKAFKGTSWQFAERHEGPVRFAFIDGDHGYENVCRDIETVERCLVPGGWLAFDDAFTTATGVDRAIEDRILASGRYECAQQVTRKCFVARRKGG